MEVLNSIHQFNWKHHQMYYCIFHPSPGAKVICNSDLCACTNAQLCVSRQRGSPLFVLIENNIKTSQPSEKKRKQKREWGERSTEKKKQQGIDGEEAISNLVY